MTTKLKRIEASLHEYGERLVELRERKGDLGGAPFEELEAFIQEMGALQGRLEQDGRDVERFVAKAKEGIKDPDRRLYGEKMTKRIFEAEKAVKKFAAMAEELAQQARVIYSPRADAKALEEAEKKRREEERARYEEEERQRKAEQEEKHAAASAREAKAEEDQKQAEKERKERDKNAVERLVYETEQRLHEQHRAEESNQLKAKRARIDKAKSMPIEDVLTLMRSNNTAKVYKGMVKALAQLYDMIMKHPEDPQFRHVRVANEAIQADLTKHEYGIEALMSLGFREKKLKEPKEEMFYVLEEPNLETEMDEWTAWYERLKTNKDLLLDTVESL